MNNMRKLMEAVQLNEYFVRAGEPFSQIQILNIFSDFTPGQKLSEFEEDFAASPEWMAIEQKYSKYVKVLLSHLKKVGKKRLSEEDAELIESVMYEGSDSYSDPETACQDLPEIYDRQLEAISYVLEIAPPNLTEAEDMLAVDPALQAEIQQDRVNNTWAVWWGDYYGDSGHIGKQLSKEKALALLKITIKAILDEWSEESYVVHATGSNVWVVKDPINKEKLRYELHNYSDGSERDW